MGNQIAIVYDGETISSPVVNEAITGGQAYITGDFTYEEAENLASTIRIGGLSLELEELRSNVVGAQLGEQAVTTSVQAGAVGLALVFVFMCFVYLLPGLASSLALLIYTGIVLVILNAFNVTLTLPGIAGIILGIGMAVDANVIIFARVKEEMTKGKSVRNALKSGFHKAMSAIVDGNVTTLIAAAVLWFRGSGSVKGFAQTLAIGILVSMFTALVITRMIVYAFYAVGIRSEKLYYRPRKEREPFHFVERKGLFFAISLVIIAAGIGVAGFNASRGNGAMNYSLEFQGGTSTNVTFNEDYTIDEIDSQIIPVVTEATGDQNVQAQKVEGTDQIIFKTTTLDLETREALDQALVDNFQVDDSLITFENISSTVSSEMRPGCGRGGGHRHGAHAPLHLVPVQGYPVRHKRCAGPAPRCADRGALLRGGADLRGQYLYRLHPHHLRLLHQRDDRHLRPDPRGAEAGAEEHGPGIPCEQEYHPDADEEHLHVPDDLYHHCGALCHGRELHPRVRSAPDGGRCVRRLLLRVHHRIPVVRHAHEDRRESGRDSKADRDGKTGRGEEEINSTGKNREVCAQAHASFWKRKRYEREMGVT